MRTSFQALKPVCVVKAAGAQQQVVASACLLALTGRGEVRLQEGQLLDLPQDLHQV